MKKTDVVFLSLPSAPHINPTLPIVSTLIRRGYRVTYATSERFAPRVAATGAEVIEVSTSRVGPSLEIDVDEPGALVPFFCRWAIRTLSAVTAYYDKWKPDLVVYDFTALAGRILAHRWRIPAAQTSPQPAFDRLNLSLQIRNSQLRDEALQLSRQADEFLQRHGVDIQDFLFQREKLTIFLFPRDFEPSTAEMHGNCFYAGRCAGEQQGFGEWRSKDYGHRPVVLVATSTTHARGLDYFRMCIDALSDLHWHVILSISDDAELTALLPLPPNFEAIHRTPHGRILPHASLLIYGGGAITAAEAMYHGVPLVMTSCGAPELEGLADHFETLGIGVHLREADMSAENIRHAALTVSNDSAMLERVKQLQHRIRREPGAEEVSNQIEEYLEVCRT